MVAIGTEEGETSINDLPENALRARSIPPLLNTADSSCFFDFKGWDRLESAVSS